MDENTKPRGVQTLQFNPDDHPYTTLKAFNEFIEQYEFRYDAQFPEVQKNMLTSAIEKFKTENADADPDFNEKQTLKNAVKSKDKVRKLLGFFATYRLQQDWKAAVPITANRDGSTWENFVETMRTYYKPTENSTLRNYEFRHLTQKSGESFSAFCNRIEKELYSNHKRNT